MCSNAAVNNRAATVQYGEYYQHKQNATQIKNATYA